MKKKCVFERQMYELLKSGKCMTPEIDTVVLVVLARYNNMYNANYIKT